MTAVGENYQHFTTMYNNDLENRNCRVQAYLRAELPSLLTATTGL